MTHRRVSTLSETVSKQSRTDEELKGPETRFHYEGAATDITGRKKTKTARENSDERLRILFEFAPDAYYLNDLKGKFIDGNKVAEEVTGFKRDELIGRSFLELKLLSPKQIPKAAALLARNALGQPTGPDEFTLNRKDGSQVTVEIRTFPVKIGNKTLVLGIARDISERKKMEYEIRTFTQFLSAAVNNSPDPIFIKDKDLRYVVVSDAACEFAGRPREEILGRTAQDLYPRDFADSVERTDREVLEKNAVVDVPGLRSVRGKEPRIYHTRKAPLIDASGNITHLISIARDVTERKRTEEALEQSEVKLKALHRHARTLAVANTIEDVAKHTLDAMEFILGFDVADFCAVENGHIHVYGSRGVQVSPSNWPLEGPGVVVKSVKAKRALRIPDTREEPSFVDRRSFSGTKELQPMLSELVVPVLSDGEAVAVLNVESNRLNAFTDENQALLETLAMHVASALGRLKQVDTLERAVEERARKLKESEERYRRLIDNMTDVVFSIDLKGNFTFCSQAAEKMTGCSVQQLLSMNMKELIAPEHFFEIQERLQARVQGERHLPPHRFEIIRIDRKRLPIEMNTSPIVERGILTGIQGIARDITELKNVEEKLRKAERLAAIGETAGMVGHDLRNPLQAIVSTTYLAKVKYENLASTDKELAQKSEMAELLTSLDDQVSYMNKIIADLQDYSNPVEPQLAESNLRQLVKDTLSAVTIPQTVRVSVEIEKDFPKLMIDSALVRRVLINLITNALQAMPDGGKLTITASNTNETATISFHDTGVGIPEENMHKLFMPLFTTKAKGQGFGLPVCKRLVEAHNGTIVVESKVGEGSTFTIKLPLRREVNEQWRRSVS